MIFFDEATSMNKISSRDCCTIVKERLITRKGEKKEGIIMKTVLLIVLCLLLGIVSAYAADMVIQVNLIDSGGIGKPIGTVTASESPYGIIFSPKLSGLTPGLHGFHVHQNADCGMVVKTAKKWSAWAQAATMTLPERANMRALMERDTSAISRRSVSMPWGMRLYRCLLRA